VLAVGALLDHHERIGPVVEGLGRSEGASDVGRAAVVCTETLVGLAQAIAGLRVGVPAVPEAGVDAWRRRRVSAAHQRSSLVPEELLGLVPCRKLPSLAVAED